MAPSVPAHPTLAVRWRACLGAAGPVTLGRLLTPTWSPHPAPTLSEFTPVQRAPFSEVQLPSAFATVSQRG